MEQRTRKTDDGAKQTLSCVDSSGIVSCMKFSDDSYDDARCDGDGHSESVIAI